MTELTLERIFSPPDLLGGSPISVRFSPDGSRVSWLQAAPDSDHLDLWSADTRTGDKAVLVSSASLTAGRELSDEEKARRERKRITQQGIVEYFWHPDAARILFPLDGQLWLYSLDDGSCQAMTTTDTFETDVRFSPNGEWISFVRAKDLFVLDLASGAETRLTSDGSDVISNGLAEFIAQEEMHRYEGYWWSPGSDSIAFIRVDESPVELTQRYEIEADHFTVFDQRYPFTGSANAATTLHVVNMAGEVLMIDLDRVPEDYLARVNWLDNQRLIVQCQDRNQQRLRVQLASVAHPAKQLFTETSDSWINLNDHFRPLDGGHRFLWGSERTGHCHLYIYSDSGHLENEVTNGEYEVQRVAAVDEANNRLWFEANIDTPLEQHLYRSSLTDSSLPERLTSEGATHLAQVSPGSGTFIDTFSSPTEPPSARLIGSDGAVICQLHDNTVVEGHPFHPYRDRRGDCEFGTLEAEDGQTLHYRLLKPAGAVAGKQYPVVVSVYGGPGVQRVRREWIPAWQHYMSARGYGIFQLDNRGSSNRGKAFEAPIYRQLGCAEVADQLTGLAWLKSLDWVAADRVAVFGHSYGGYMTLMLLANAPGEFAAGISVAPVTDWMLYDTHYTERFLSHPDDNQEGYAASAVWPTVCNIRDPLLLIHGMADDNVLFTHTTQLMKVFHEHNVQFDLMTYPGAKHGISGSANNIHRYTMMDNFLDRHLLQ